MRKTTMRRTLATCRGGRKPSACPRRWLVTDATRLSNPLPAIARLKSGDGVVFRHYELTPSRRLALGLKVAALCRRQGLTLLVAGDAGLARRLGADGVHLPEGLVRRLAPGHGLLTAAAHDTGAVARAARAGAEAVLISPVFATASHPGAAGLGPVRFAALAIMAARRGLRVYALGGMSELRLRRLHGLPLAGFAAIGSLS